MRLSLKALSLLAQKISLRKGPLLSLELVSITLPLVWYFCTNSFLHFFLPHYFFASLIFLFLASLFCFSFFALTKVRSKTQFALSSSLSSLFSSASIVLTTQNEARVNLLDEEILLVLFLGNSFESYLHLFWTR